MKKTFAAVVYKEKKLYVAECPEAGTASQGKTIEEALLNLKEATELYLEEFPARQHTHPLLTTFEVPVHAWAAEVRDFLRAKGWSAPEEVRVTEENVKFPQPDVKILGSN